MNIRKLKKIIILDVIIMIISWALMLTIDYVSTYDDRYRGLSSSLGWYAVFRIIFFISLAILALILSIIIIRNINMRRLKIFALLDATVMVVSWILMRTIDYIRMHDDRYSGLSSSLGWVVVFGIIFFISAGLLALALSIIIIHKIIRNMQRLKIFAVLDGIVMIVSGGLMYIFGYLGTNSRTKYVGLYLKGGWNLVFEIIFQITLILLVLALTIIIMHKIVDKVIQKIKEIKNRT